MGLSWHQVTEAHVVSSCGRFSINRSGYVGFQRDDGSFFGGYLAWVISRSGEVGTDPWGVIGCFATFAYAQKVCEQHARVVFRDRT
jgi:hypothetical protein